MSNSPGATAGPSQSALASRTDSNLLRQFVMEYLQSHGFDKALAMFQQGIADQGADDGTVNAISSTNVNGGKDDGEEEGDGGGLGRREVIFRAPGPIPLESNVKRNIPQAQALSASALSERITPDFEAQARYIIDQLQKKVEASNNNALDGDGDDQPAKVLKDAPNDQGSLLDSSDRVAGYAKYRRWVDNGLDIWKAELDNISFPLFVHTFLELIDFGFLKSARDFFEKHHAHHRPLHPQEISSLASVSTKDHVCVNNFCQRILSEKYTIPLSRNPHDLLLQWLSGAGLDEEWEAGRNSAAGRAKEAVKAIVFEHVDIKVTTTSTPLDEKVIATTSGLIASSLHSAKSLEAFNSATTLKLGPPPMTEKLKEQVARTVRDEEIIEQNGNGHGVVNGNGNALNGHANGDANGDIDMTSPSRDRNMRSPTVQEIKLEPDTERDPDLISPEEGETNPPIPPVFRIPDLKREVEAIRDRRKMIRLGPNADKAGSSSGSSTVLPSVVAFTLFDQGENASAVEFSRDSSLMAVGSSESCVRLWSLKGEKLKGKSVDPMDGSLVEDEGLPMRKLIGHSGPVYSLSFDPVYGSAAPPSALLSSSQDGTVRLWSLDTYSNLVVYRGHGRDPVWDVEWGPMGVYFATASRDRTARLWSSDRVTPLRMYTGHLSDVNVVKFHPNSLYLATGSNDNSCRLWDVQRGGCVRLFLGHTDAVTTMAISPDGKYLASAGLDHDIWLWDLGSARPIKKMSGHKAPIQSLSFSADTSVLVSGGLDSTVRCWDIKSSGGEKVRSTDTLGIGESGRRGNIAAGQVEELGTLPMGPGDLRDDSNYTSDLLATFSTKRTPILKTHYTSRNLCMVAGNFVPPSSGAAGRS